MLVEAAMTKAFGWIWEAERLRAGVNGQEAREDGRPHLNYLPRSKPPFNVMLVLRG
jgi:hypothetical protein